VAAAPIILDSVTHLEPGHRGQAAVCASHGGRYAAWYAADVGIGAVILNDAGIGREGSGIGGMDLLAAMRIPAACVSHRSARIGDGMHTFGHGVLSAVNAPALELGLVMGMQCREALSRLSAAPLDVPARPAPAHEARSERPELGRAGVRVIVMDSNGLVTPEDAGHVIVTASHGGLLGGRPATAVKYPVFAAVYNDAGRGIDDAGISRLPALEARGIAGACVSAFSARIGDGASTLDDGFICALNPLAQRHGGAIGQSCRQFVAAMVEARARSMR
jgi:hypothetical protein